MQSEIFNTPFIKIDSLKTKFDTLVVSNSFIAVVGDHIEALFLHQLHYWSYSQYGVVIDDVRWIYKPLREWLSEIFTFLTEWKLRKAIASLLEKGLIERKKLYVKHHEIKHDNSYWNPKNQTYYYSVNYDELQKRIEQVEGTKNAESTENVRFENLTKLSIEDSLDTKFCDCPQNKTDLTSIENNSKDKSHPHLPCVSEIKKKNSQEKDFDNRQVLQKEQINSFSSTVIKPDINNGRVDEKVNKFNCTIETDVQESVRVEVEKPVPKPKPKTPKGTKSKTKRRNEAPWKDQGQFKRFYRALILALPMVANARSPQGLAQVIIRQLRSGIPHSYWDDFAAGLPIGSSTKPEWEVEPGVPYPMFIEYLTEKIIKGNNTQTTEQARNEVFRILSQPRQAQAFWGQFKRSVVNVSQQVSRDRALGVSNPHTPVWTRERIEPSIEEAAEAGDKIRLVNGSTQAVLESVQAPELESKPESADPWNENEGDRDQPNLKEMLAQRRIKGFCKPMPQVSKSEIDAEERKRRKSKNNIAQMSLTEINDYLTDPILRAQLMPQLIDSDYELITDELGQIIRVELSELQKREKRRLERESS